MAPDDAMSRQLQALGAFIHSQRTQAQLTLRELSERTNVSNPYLSQIERGLHEPSVRVLKAIAIGGDRRRPPPHRGPTGQPALGVPHLRRRPAHPLTSRPRSAGPTGNGATGQPAVEALGASPVPAPSHYRLADQRPGG
jgi:hypothetical protein